MMIYDIVRGCRKSNRQSIVEARQTYYFKLITAYEEDKLNATRETLDGWVRKGDLRDGLTTEESMEKVQSTTVTI